MGIYSHSILKARRKPAAVGYFGVFLFFTFIMPPPMQTLKQRLVGLQQAATGTSSSASSSPSRSTPRIPNFGAVGSAIAKRKAQFKASWIDRPSENGTETGENCLRIDEVLSKMIFQAGVDYECVFLSSL